VEFASKNHGPFPVQFKYTFYDSIGAGHVFLGLFVSRNMGFSCMGTLGHAGEKESTYQLLLSCGKEEPP